jgi:glc operon protein GlcG
MKRCCSFTLASTFIILSLTAPVGAQQPAPSPPPTTPYGPPITLDAAKKVMVAAEAEATKNNWAMAITILGSTGCLDA